MKPCLIERRFIDDGVTYEPGDVAQFDVVRAVQLAAFGLVSDAPEAAFELNTDPESAEQNEAETQPKRNKRSK
jgi:hypothetical protein